MIRIALIVSCIFILISAFGAAAEKRVALVIGNSAYENAPELVNPKNDAAIMAEKLKELEFEVLEGIDLPLGGMLAKIEEFSDRLTGADVAAFYYAGHGLQVNGQNYLIPTDASLKSHIKLDYEAVPIDLVLASMEEKGHTNLLFLDACRDNPMARSLARAMGTRSTAIGRGLARIGAGRGTMVSFATEPGNVALDGLGVNSPYTSALVKYLGTPGESLSDTMISVRRDVIEATSGNQVPWEHSSLTGRVILKDAPTVEELNEPAVGGEIAYWNSIRDVDVKEFYEAYLKQYPTGMFAGLAKAKISFIDRRRAEEKLAAEELKKMKVAKEQQIAALEQPLPDLADAILDPRENKELVRSIQKELNRVGCSAGTPDGIWGRGTERAASDYKKHGKSDLASLEPSQAMLDNLKSMNMRVCPLACGRNQEEKNGRCVAVKQEAKPVPDTSSTKSQHTTSTTRTTSAPVDNQKVCYSCQITTANYTTICINKGVPINSVSPTGRQFACSLLTTGSNK